MALVHLLLSVQDALKLNLQLLYVDHGLRNVDTDIEVIRFVEKNLINTSVVIEKIDVKKYAREHKYSIEEAARYLRYGVLEEYAENYDFRIVTTGHHQDDLAETVLMHLLEGSGLSGMAGVRMKSGRLVRPLLFFRKKDLVKYCRNNNLPFSVDKTNDELIYKRNKIRKVLIPFLEKKFQAKLTEKIFQFGMILQKEEEYLKNKVNSLIFKEGVNYLKISADDIDPLSPWQMKILLERINEWAGEKRKCGFEKFTAFYFHFSEKKRTVFQLSNKLNFKREKNGCYFYVDSPNIEPELLTESTKVLVKPYDLSLTVRKISDEEEKKVILEKLNKVKKKRKHLFSRRLYLKVDKTEWPLTVCGAEDGKFKPMGLDFVVPVKDYLRDYGIPKAVRNILPVVKNKQGKIIAICGIMPDEDHAVNKSSKQFFEIKFFNFKKFFV